MSDKLLVKKHLRWLQSDVGISLDTIEHAAMAGCISGEDSRNALGSGETILVCLTKTHFGFYHSRWFSKHRGSVELCLIQDIMTFDERNEISVCAPKVGKIRFYFEEVSEYKSFAERLIRERQKWIGAIRTEYQDFLNQITAPVDDRLLKLRALCSKERFHCSLWLWTLILNIEAGATQAAKNMILTQGDIWHAIAEQNPGRFAEILAELDFTASESLELLATSGINEASTEFWKLAIGSIVAIRNGNYLLASLYLASFQNGGNKKVVLEMPAQKIEAIKFSAFIRRLIKPYRSLWKDMGLGLKWVLDEQDENDAKPAPDRKSLNMRVEQMEKHWFDSIFEYFAYTNNRRQCEDAWDELRSGIYEGNCSSIVHVGNKEKWSLRYRALPPQDPRYFWSAIIACEVLLRNNQGLEAKAVLAEAYRKIGSIEKGCDNELVQHSLLLSRFYIALCDGKRDLASIYARYLPESFGWTQTLINDIFEVDDHVFDNNDIEGTLVDFREWLRGQARNKKSISNQYWADVQNLESALKDNQLRIVIGGETSAGKSTFLNKLLGIDLLVADRLESTAVPTHIAYSANWKVEVEFEGTASPLSWQWNNEEETLLEIQDVIQKYGSLSAETHRSVKRVKISGPISVLATGLELIDNPGLNAHTLRTELAFGAIESAHACVFLMDARNALKGGEMKAIKLGEEILGRTIFVLNKTDLIQNASEFDVGDDPLEAVVDYVRSQLRNESSKESEAEIYAVTSLGKLEFDEIFKTIAERLTDIAQSGKKALILNRARRLAGQIAQTSVEECLNQVVSGQRTMDEIRKLIPADPKRVVNFLQQKTRERWQSHRSEYLSKSLACLHTAEQKVSNEISDNAITGSIDDFTKFLKRNLDRIIKERVEAIAALRNEIWSHFVQLLMADVNGYFSKLYRDMNLTCDLDVNVILAQMEAPALPKSQSFFGELDKELNDVGGTSTATGVVFAVVGATIGGPVGAAAGYALGTYAGAATKRDGIKNSALAKVQHLVQSHFVELRSLIERDFASAELDAPVTLKIVFDQIDKAMHSFEVKVNTRMREMEEELKRLERSNEHKENMAIEGERWRRKLSKKIDCAKRVQLHNAIYS